MATLKPFHMKGGADVNNAKIINVATPINNNDAANKAYVDSVMKSWADKWESGEISDDEYFANCPQGYECWSCGYCGKWTGNFK